MQAKCILGNCRLPVEVPLLLFALSVNENVTQERTTELTPRLPSQDLDLDMIALISYLVFLLLSSVESNKILNS